MNPFKFDVSFRIRHPDLDPKQICSTLGMDAKYKWKAGAQRKTPKGDLLEGVYTETYCSFEIEHNESIGLVELLRLSNQKLQPHKEFLELIRSTGGDLEYFIGWYSSGNSGEEFTWDLITDLADLQIGLSFDFYGGP